MAIETASGARVAGPLSEHVSAATGIGSCTLCALAVWAVLTDTPTAHLCAAIAFLFFLLLAQGRFGLRERMLQGLALLVTADRILQMDPSPAAIYLMVLTLVPLASCIGLPPMMTVTFLAGLLVSMPDLDLDPSILGLTFLSGWALNLTGSPFSATSLILSRIVGIPGVVHAWKWNGIFTIVSWCVTAMVVLAVARWLG